MASEGLILRCKVYFSSIFQVNHLQWIRSEISFLLAGAAGHEHTRDRVEFALVTNHGVCGFDLAGRALWSGPH